MPFFKTKIRKNQKKKSVEAYYLEKNQETKRKVIIGILPSYLNFFLKIPHLKLFLGDFFRIF